MTDSVGLRTITSMTKSPTSAPEKFVAPFGSWPSPISSSALTAATIGISETLIDAECIYWLENRPEQKGRTTIMQYRNGTVRDLLPAPINTRSKVNEYGGGSYCVYEGIVYFVLYDDQRIYRLDSNNPKALPEPITSPTEIRFADLQYDPHRQRLIAVAEDHTHTGSEARTYLVTVNLQTIDGQQIPVPLVEGDDFYASPKLSPDGKQLLWLSWNHPNMPWDNNCCWLADLDNNGDIISKTLIAGGDNAGESIMQPQFSPTGTIVFVSDRSISTTNTDTNNTHSTNNWWNLFQYNNGEIACLHPMAAEFAGPLWVFGQGYFSFLDDQTIVGCCSQHGNWLLYQLNIVNGEFKLLETPCVDIAYLHASNKQAVFVGTGTSSYNAVYSLRDGHITTLMSPSECKFNKADLATGEILEFPLSSRQGKGHAFYYPPTNSQYRGPNNQLPPLLVFCHGGPTAATRSSLNLKIQFWTSRGFAVVDINYGGSTGFGRQYREALKAQWGIIDVQDCIDCVNFLVDKKLADANKLAIRGGSAGGYTVLCALTFHDVFKAGASYYGIGDLETLATDTHKFESRYLDSLVGPYPECKAEYKARSPIHHLENMRCPVIFFQGLLDKVVPPNQAEAMVKALDQKHIAHAYVTFAEEGHGFRQAPNQRRSLEAELYFYSQVFDFPLADAIEPVLIHHLREH